MDIRVLWRWGAAVVTPLALSGCETIAITAMGVGASAGVSHTANSISSRTFTLPTPRVRAASLLALERMGVTVDSIDRRDASEVISGSSADRRIEVEIEPMSRTTTQVRALAKRSFFVYDAATAREIIAQTERALGAAPERRGKTAPLATARSRVAGGARADPSE
jgi:hypothetical protein